MIKWIRYGKRVGPEGTTITYEGLGSLLIIESRKRHIPHANGIGTWDHTTFVVIDNQEGIEVTEKATLKEAMAFAEEYRRTK